MKLPYYRSLFFKLNLLFAIGLVLLSLLFLHVKRHEQMERHRQIAQRAMELSRLLHHGFKTQEANWTQEAQEANFVCIHDTRTPCNARPLHLPMLRHQEQRALHVLTDNEGTIFYRFERGGSALLFEDRNDFDAFRLSNLLFVALFAGLLLLYLTMRQSLLPLRTLASQIRRFAEGETQINTQSRGKDEIALISNEFHDAVARIRQLESTRTLFWRNIMHELKTPLTKGKLALALLDENPDTLYLHKVFERMDALINQMAQIEKLDHAALFKNEAALVALTERAIERLYLDTPSALLDVQIPQALHVRVDEELFISALSNLIDNAIKYADTYPITLRADHERLYIRNAAAPMRHGFEANKTPFVGEHAKSGLGLGLYIAEAIAQKHGFRLEYAYVEGMHQFCIVWGEQC
ncbi:MAG: HAMP domain-containing histidine kinase [Campylobacterales bacterium]|nr:HAMP domain-containing histidine kinase [Campylobacterales bacterium]